MNPQIVPLCGPVTKNLTWTSDPELLVGDNVRAVPCRCRGQLTVNFAPVATGTQTSSPASNDHEFLVCFIGRNIYFEDFHVLRFHFGRRPISGAECASDLALWLRYSNTIQYCQTRDGYHCFHCCWFLSVFYCMRLLYADMAHVKNKFNETFFSV
jgi:hypothetical protein